MSDFTFLTAEQCCGDNQLDILRKRGIRAAITDFAVLHGGWISDYRTKSSSSLEDRTGFYWTKSEDEFSNALIVDVNASIDTCNTSGGLSTGARPALPFSSISNIPTNGESGKRARDGILEVEYGYYPQKAVSRDMQERLEREFNSFGSKLRVTGNHFTTESEESAWYHRGFIPKTHTEYEYCGRKFIRVQASFDGDVLEENDDVIVLSNGEKYRDGDYVWVEVLPVKWLVDEKAKIMTTEKIIFAGVQFFEYIDTYHTEDFDKSDIKKFMDEYLSKEMFQERIVEGQSKGVQFGEKRKDRRKNTNPYNLDFSEIEEEDVIRGAIESNVAVFLHGKPGCGKSARVKQLDPDFIELNLSHLDPELLDGLAGERDGKAVHIRPPWLEELEAKCEEEPDRIHILFLEELTNASPVMQSKAYGIALDKKVAGRWKLPENARVVAAGNEIEDSLVANEMSEPLYDRFAHVNIETEVDDWLEWAVTPEESYERIEYKPQDKSRPKIHPAIYAYISYRGEEVLRTPYNREHPEPHADPRRWEMASRMLYATKNPTTLRAIVGGDITRDFISFCQMPTITVEDAITGNYTEEELEEMNLGRQLATVSGLVAVDEENMPAVRRFVKKLGPEMCKKFEAQWAHGDEERLEKLQEVIMEEQEEKEKQEHRGEEAENVAQYGVTGYRTIEGEYQGFLSRKIDEEEQK